MERAIVHMDLDTFFVSCERKNNSGLIGKPIIIGGGDRGVVASCSYESRYFGKDTKSEANFGRCIISSKDTENQS